MARQMLGPVPFPHIPLDETRDRLSADQLEDMLVDQWLRQMPPELMLEIILSGKEKFLSAALSPLKNLGMSERNVLNIWRRICEQQPKVLAAVGGPVS